MTSFVHYEGLEKSYDGTVAVKDFNLSVEKGQFVAFVGPSGCGKSTVLRMTAGLETITGGTISIDGRVVNDVEPRDRDIAMVFQNYALYPDKTVAENMAFGLRMRNTAASEVEARVRSAAAILRLEPLLERRPAQLSGGQRQRVAVGRVIVRNPKVFLFDEPLSNLDAHLRASMRREIIKLHKRLRATMIYVTHDQIEAMTMGDVIVVMKDGRVQQHGRPLDLFNRPENVFVASFIGAPAMNLVRAVLSDEGGVPVLRMGECLVPLPPQFRAKLGKATGQEVVFGVRPQDIAVRHGRAGEGLSAKITLAERLGTETLVELDAAGTILQARLSPNVDVEEGANAAISIDFAHTHFFDPVTERALLHGADVLP
jgi:multiple sugar transport system ATP-binding protein